MSRPRLLALTALAAVAAIVALGMPGQSGATFVARTTHATSTVTAAADWTPPVVAVRNPGSPVKGTLTVTADASDGESGIAAVVLQHRPSDTAAWTTICTTSAAPASCPWNTTAVADGPQTLRAVATDRAGYSTTSDVVGTVVANNVLVELDTPGDVVRGAVPLTARVDNAGSLAHTVTIQYAVADSTAWKDVCKIGAAPYTCTWSTAGLVSGGTYDLRAVATSGSSSTVSEVIGDVLVDNTAPTVTMVDPGSPLRGTVTLAANAADGESGIAGVQLQHLRSGTSTWITACSPEDEPYTCRFDTTTLASGTYSFRAIATDAVGFATTSAVVANRTVDNTVASVSMENPGAVLTGTVTLAASASSTAGITSVRIDRAPSGTTSWTAVCTDQTAPYSCSWNTATVADGLYDFRAVMIDSRGVTTTSATTSARRVDNSPLRGYDVQAVNGGTAGRLDAGDVLRLTYTDQVRTDSISPGWTGTATPVTVRLRDGNLLGLGSSGDTLDVLRNGAAVNLGSVNLKQDFVKFFRTTQLNATMVATTATVNGVPQTTVTLTLGSVSSGGSGLRTASRSGALVWTPSASATDLAGAACSTSATTELGTSDRDF